MSNLIRCQPVAFVGLYAARPGSVRPQEPIPVDVRIRPREDGSTALSHADPGLHRFDRLPVGTLLDCTM